MDKRIRKIKKWSEGIKMIIIKKKVKTNGVSTK
jgi:hypothetical protein